MGLNIVSAHFAFVKNVEYVVVMRYIEQFILAINRARNRINKMLTWDVTSWKPHNHNLPVAKLVGIVASPLTVCHGRTHGTVPDSSWAIMSLVIS
tara:strand:- start:321 stop:605 length:285 start_codon:yes stop_codon:yes gene_type:complete